jgi:VWFA-related protein
LFGTVISLTVAGQQSGSPPSTQQQNQSTDDVLVVTTNLVQVDVVVTDKDGHHVTNLQPKDFEVYEDKKVQTISNLSYISTGGKGADDPATEGSSPGVAPSRAQSSREQRTLAIVVDDLGISFESITFVREALRKFVDEQMQPGDKVALFLTSKRIGSRQQFTSDKARLREAIDDVRFNPNGHGGLSPFEREPPQMKDPTEIPELANRSAQALGDLEAARAENYSVGTLATLNFIMRGLGEMPGRKAMMIFAESFRLFTNQGRNLKLLQYLRRLTDQANLASTVIYTTDASGLDPQSTTASEKVLGLSYTFDPKILEAVGGGPLGSTKSNQSTAAPSLREISRAEGGSSAAFKNLDELMNLRDTHNIESQSVLSLLANDTGGIFTRNTNDLSLGTRRMLEDQKGYYLIGYRPNESVIDPQTGRRRYHNLTVKVKRPGLRVRSREGYYGITTEEARKMKKTREEQLAAALTSPFNAGGLDVRLTPLFFNDPKAGSYMQALLHLNPRELTFTPEANGARKAVLDVLAVNFGEGGRVVDQFNDTQTITVPAAAHEQLLQSGLSFVLNVPVKQPGAYQLHIAVRDAASENVGAAGQYIEVPDLSRKGLTLSGIVLSGTRSHVVANVPSSPPDVPSAKGGSDLQFSAAVRRARQGMTLKYDYVIYHSADGEANSHPPQLETQMRLLREGKLVYSGALLELDLSKQTDPRRLQAGGRVYLRPDFTPGVYVLQVVVRQTGPKEKPALPAVTQSIDFEIVN